MNEELFLSPAKQMMAQSYDPFGNPPSLELAETHRKATMVGTFSSHENPQFCPCCDNIINKQSLPICFKDDELLSIGVGYPLYYKLAKYYIGIMVGIFFISGSAIYFLMTLQCQLNQTCFTMFGIPIINISIAESTNLNKTQIANMAMSIAIFLIVVYLKTLIIEDIRLLTSKKLCPSLYTVMLQNVPIIDDEALTNWVQQCFGQKPVLINWAYDIDELRAAYKEKQSLVIDLNKINILLRKIPDNELDNSNSILNQVKKDQKTNEQLISKRQKLKEKIKSCQKILKNYNLMDKQCEKIGTVFVSFQKMQTVNRILEDYQCSFFNSLLKNVFSFIKKSKLQLNNQVIIVNKAPAPLEVIWDNLQFSYIRNIVFEIIFIVTMLILLVLALKVIFIFMNAALDYRIEGEKSGHIELILKGSVMSLIIIVINCLMRLVIQVFTAAKKYYSYTKEQASFCLYYSIFYIINACCLVYMVHGSTKNDTTQLLLTDIHLIMIANAFSQPLFKLVDPVMWYRVIMRIYVTRLKPEENPYTQQYVNKLWEGHAISNADNYQYITRVLFVTTWFASVAPVGVLLSLIGFILDYWITKALLAKVYKIPENISEDIASPSLMGLELLPLVYICGVLQFSYKVSSNSDIFQFFYDFLHYGITTLVILLSVCGYLIFCKKELQPDSERTYSQTKLAFGFNYETTNPITKYRGDINYLYDVLKNSSDNLERSQIISDLLKQSQKHPFSIQYRREEVNKIKMNMHKKLSEDEHQMQMSELRATKFS